MLMHGTAIYAQASATTLFSTNLFLGSRGAQVVLLQKQLNKDPETRIANTGNGSPGYETDYFGSLTKDAVIRFQEKYADEILTPVGLLHGNGRVGLYTRGKLKGLSVQSDTNVPALSPTTIVAQTSAPQATTSSTNTSITSISNAKTQALTATEQTNSTNPNLKNIDKYLSAIAITAKEQGFSDSAIALMKERIISNAATTTDLRATFLKLVSDKARTVKNTHANKIFAFANEVFEMIFIPERAHAAVAAPFGGKLLFATMCDGGIWNITIEPLPPAFPVLLSYVSESQLFVSNNIPFTDWLLGTYMPVPSTYCWEGIYPYPSQGMITPMVGSSPM